jgi:hypothetical protein
MQTNKKYVKKHMKKKKKKYVSKKNRQFLCYKIRFYNYFKEHVVGGSVLSDANKEKLIEFLDKYLEYIKTDDKTTHENNNDIYKYLNDILNYDNNVENVKDDGTFKKTNDFENAGKKYYKTQLLEDIYDKLEMAKYFGKEIVESEKETEKENKYTELTIFLKDKAESTRVFDSIKDQLKKLVEGKKITQSKADSVIRQLKGVSIISTSLSTINDSVLKNANSFGKWLSPKQFDADDSTIGVENEQTIKFLWYPRKHINYRKGSSVPKSYSNDNKYGDFMIYIDSPKYTDIGEYFKTSYNSVEDLFANILAGCDDMFCTKGNVKPTFYNSRLFIVKDKIIKDTK